MKRQRGFVYILALVVVLVTTAVALTVARGVALRTQAQQAATARTQCRAAATGVLRAIMTDLAATKTTSGLPGLTTVNAAGESVGDCTVVLVGRDPNGKTLRCGLIPAAGKLSLSVDAETVLTGNSPLAVQQQAAHTQQVQSLVDHLALLPGIDSSIAAALIDWADTDDAVDSNGGAERTDGAYAGAAVPFAPRNALIETMDELRLVRGVTDSIYFGEDRNGNGMLDAGEDDNGDGLLTLGLHDLLALDSRVPTNQGAVNVTSNLSGLVNLLRSLSDRGNALADAAQLHRSFANRLQVLADLGLTEVEATTLWPTISDNSNRACLVDAWSCPNAILTALTNDTIAATIAAARPTTAPTSPLWLAQALGANAAVYGSLFTFGSWQFDVDLLAVRNDGAGWGRLQATIDCYSGKPVLIQLRPAETQGWPFPWATLAMIRSGDAGSDLATFLTTPATR